MNSTNGSKLIFLSVIAVVLVSIVAFYDHLGTSSMIAEAHTPNVVLSGFGTATIDGVINPGEWVAADQIDFTVNVPGGGTAPGTLYVMNDANNLYLAVWFAYTSQGNSASFQFDNDHDGGVLVDGDDILIFNPDPTIEFEDSVRTTEPPCPAGTYCRLFDTAVSGTNDGSGAFANSGGATVYEFSHPLDSIDDAHDFSLVPGDVIGFNLDIRLIVPPSEYPEDFGDTSFPAPTLTEPWSYGDIVIASPPIPVDIDIKPGCSSNKINLASNGVIPVVVMGSDIFDVTDIDVTSLEFGPDRAVPAHDLTDDPYAYALHVKDVNADGYLDLVCHYRVQETGLEYGDTAACLTAEVAGGANISGCDIVNIKDNP